LKSVIIIKLLGRKPRLIPPPLFPTHNHTFKSSSLTLVIKYDSNKEILPRESRNGVMLRGLFPMPFSNNECLFVV